MKRLAGLLLLLTLAAVSAVAQYQEIYGDLQRGEPGAGVPSYLLEGVATLPTCQPTADDEAALDDVVPGGAALLTAVDGSNQPGWYRCTSTGWTAIATGGTGTGDIEGVLAGTGLSGGGTTGTVTLNVEQPLPGSCTAGQIAERNTGNTAWVCGTDDTGGSGSTNLGIGTRTATTVPITSSSGTDATFPAATTSLAGALSGTDKTKLDGIASGAEVNVQSDWNEATTTEDDFILNKPTIPALTPGTNVLPTGCTADQIAKRNTGNTAWTCQADATGSGGGTTNLGIGTRTTTTVPITSSSGDDATFPAATTALAGAMTSTDKTKLDGIESNALAADSVADEVGADLNALAEFTYNATTNVYTFTSPARDFGRANPVTFTGSGTPEITPADANNGRIWNYTDSGTPTINYINPTTNVGDFWRAGLAHTGSGGLVTVQGNGAQLATVRPGESGIIIFRNTDNLWRFLFMSRWPAEATSSVAGLMSAADKAKLDSLTAPVTDNNVRVWASATQTVSAIASTAVSGWPTVTLAAPAANSFLIVAQLAADNDLTSMEKDGVEQFTAITKNAATFTDSGETFEYWASTSGPLFPSTLAGTYTFAR